MEEALEDFRRANETPTLRKEVKKSQEITEQLDLNPRKFRDTRLNNMCVCEHLWRMEAAEVDLSRTNHIR